jgi:hypothetical protein
MRPPSGTHPKRPGGKRIVLTSSQGPGSAERLHTDDGEELKLVVALAARDRGVDEQTVRLVRVEQRLAVQFQHADLGVDEALDLGGADAHFVVLPQAPELLALLQEKGGVVCCPGIGTS